MCANNHVSICDTYAYHDLLGTVCNQKVCEISLLDSCIYEKFIENVRLCTILYTAYYTNTHENKIIIQLK